MIDQHPVAVPGLRRIVDPLRLNAPRHRRSPPDKGVPVPLTDADVSLRLVDTTGFPLTLCIAAVVGRPPAFGPRHRRAVVCGHSAVVGGRSATVGSSLARSEHRAEMPSVDRQRERVSPGAALKRPFSLVRAPHEEQA